MSNGIEYLVKYSVAPPPSRDYYGLKVLQDEVILYLWRISHGPHKAPIVRRAKLAEFDREKSLQDEIRHGFGERLLKHVKNIAEGNRNTLLTLPKSLIGRITRYLEFTDVVKLSSLSHVAYEVFNGDSVWQILYKRDKTVKISAEEREKAKVYDWKRLYKDRQMQTSIKDRRVRDRDYERGYDSIKTCDKYIAFQKPRVQSSIKHTNDTKINKPSLKSNTCDASKCVSKTTSTINVAAGKRSEFSGKDLVTIPFSKVASDTRFRDLNVNTEKEKPLTRKNNDKIANRGFSASEKNVKRGDLVAPTITKRETRSVFKCGDGFDKRQNKSERCIDKINSVKATPRGGKARPVAPRVTSLSKSVVGNVKSSSDLSRSSHDKTRSRAKPKKVATTKSEILDVGNASIDDPFVVGDGNFDLADLIEASLKNIRSPRCIFDYDFSCVQQTDARRDASRIRNEIQNIDRSVQPKSIRSNVNPNYLFKKMTREDGILEKLSEKSEPYSGTSTESLAQDRKPLSDEYDKPLTEKYTNARTELRKSLDWRRSGPVLSEHGGVPSRSRDTCLTISPRKIGSVDERLPVAKGPLRGFGLLKAYASNSLESRKSVPAKNSEVVPKNRVESARMAGDIGEID